MEIPQALRRKVKPALKRLALLGVMVWRLKKSPLRQKQQLRKDLRQAGHDLLNNVLAVLDPFLDTVASFEFDELQVHLKKEDGDSIKVYVEICGEHRILTTTWQFDAL